MSGFDPGPGWREVDRDTWRRMNPGRGLMLTEETGDHYWVREEPVTPLPTEPGYYLTTEPDYGGGPVVVELLNRPAGQWVDAGDRQYLTRMQVEDMLPLLRLEPRDVTAKAVLDRVRDLLPHSAANEPRVGEVLSTIAREFGVES